MGDALDTRKALAGLVNEALTCRSKQPLGRFYKEVVAQTLNFIWGKHYRKNVIDFTSENPWIESYVRDMLVIICETLNEFRDALPDDAARSRLDNVFVVSMFTPT